MRYQITCDNCGAQFLINAQPGQTIECRCPDCQGVMRITLPNPAKGEHYQPPRHNGQDNPYTREAHTVDGVNHPNRQKVWIVIALLVVVAAAIGFAMFHTSGTPAPPPEPVALDTIPYEQPVREEPPQQQVDTIVEQTDIPEEEEIPLTEEELQTAPEATDTIASE